MNTIKTPPGTSENPFITDLYQRPVQWIISVPGIKALGEIKNLVIISPHEANELKATIEKFAKITLHLFLPRTNVSYQSLDHLQLWTTGQAFDPETVPRSLTVQLNLFSGSLYLRSFDEYIELCDMLGLLRSHAQPGQSALPDGFITTSVGQWGLKKSPVAFLRGLVMRVRREGEGLEKTHMGRILDGARLEEADFRMDVHMAG